MFKNFFNKAEWLHIAEQTKSEKIKKAITELFIPNKIDINKYEVNEHCYNQEDTYDSSTNKYCTVSMAYWVERLHNDNIPLGFPKWFYAAFPDVAKWTQTQDARTILQPFFELNKCFLEDNDHKLRLFVLKRIVDSFLICTGKKLEVSI